MSNIVKFGQKPKPKKPATTVVKQATHINKDVLLSTQNPYLLEGLNYLRGHDFRNSFANHPDEPVSGCMTKEEILNLRVPVWMLVQASLMAVDIANDKRSSKLLMQAYNQAVKMGIRFVVLGGIHPELIGFVVHIGQHLGRLPDESHPHPAGRILSVNYGLIFTCWKATI